MVVVYQRDNMVSYNPVKPCMVVIGLQFCLWRNWIYMYSPVVYFYSHL